MFDMFILDQLEPKVGGARVITMVAIVTMTAMRLCTLPLLRATPNGLGLLQLSSSGSCTRSSAFGLGIFGRKLLLRLHDKGRCTAYGFHDV